MHTVELLLGVKENVGGGIGRDRCSAKRAVVTGRELCELVWRTAVLLAPQQLLSAPVNNRSDRLRYSAYTQLLMINVARTTHNLNNKSIINKTL